VQSDTFGYIVSLSGALILDDMQNRTNNSPLFMECRDYAESIFGNLNELLEPDKNPKWLVQHLKKKNKQIPKIYMACGVDDMLLKANREMYKFLTENDIELIKLLIIFPAVSALAAWICTLF